MTRAEVLAAHLPIRSIRMCECGVRGPGRPMPDRGEFEAAWAAHVADALAKEEGDQP